MVLKSADPRDEDRQKTQRRFLIPLTRTSAAVAVEERPVASGRYRAVYGPAQSPRHAPGRLDAPLANAEVGSPQIHRAPP